MKKLTRGSLASIVALFCLTTAVASLAQTYTAVAGFSPAAGEVPQSPLVQGTDGNFYGTTFIGGSNAIEQYCGGVDNSHGCGTVFRVTPAGKITALYSFCSQASCADGGQPLAGLTLGANGNLYGTTSTGGANNVVSGGTCNDLGCGTVFEITPAGKLTVLHNFCALDSCTDGVFANNLVLGYDGNLYGTTTSGGSSPLNSPCQSGCGTVFKITPSGEFTTIYTFCSKVNENGACLDGMIPVAGLTQATNGKFYGTTLYGGTSGWGDVFEITPDGKFTQIYSFCSQPNCSDGIQRDPGGQLVQAAGGNFYGTTGSAGVNGGGTFFVMTPSGQLTTLYSFCFSDSSPCPDGSNPASLSLGTDGNFYGITIGGGIYPPCGGIPFGCGVAFAFSPSGQFSNLYTFCPENKCTQGAADGEGAEGFTQATSGTFYGIANKGGRADCYPGGGCGVVFTMEMGLGPFVTANPNGARAGRVVTILGNNLTGATSVTFNGVGATTFKAFDTYIEAEVPTGATTGTIEVTTPSGTLDSNIAFQVLP